MGHGGRGHQTPMPKELDLEERTAPLWSEVLGYVGNNTAREKKEEETTMKDSVDFEPGNLAELRCFFEANKDEVHEIWIILTKKKYMNPQPVSFNEAVSEAMKQGLIDSRTKTLDEQKYAIRFTKRKTKT